MNNQQLCDCETGSKLDKVNCFKKSLRVLYKTTGVYNSEIEEHLNIITNLEDFDFINSWDLSGYNLETANIGGVVSGNKNTIITTKILTSNIILNRFFHNLSKNHRTFQRIIKLPESTIYTRIFQESI